MSEPVHGTYCILSMWVTDQYYPVLCGTDTTYTCTPEMIERTGPTSGMARQWFRRLEEHKSTVTGLTKVENDTALTFWYMLQTGIRRQTQLFKQTFADAAGNFKSLTGYALIGTQSINGPVADFSSGSIDIFWDGEPSMDVIAPPSGFGEVEDPLYIPIVADEISVHHALLEQTGVEILQVRRNGLSLTPTTGTPGNQEYKFVGGAGNGNIFTDVNVPYVLGEQPIYVLYKL
jgi:hypothetical protein